MPPHGKVEIMNKVIVDKFYDSIQWLSENPKGAAFCLIAGLFAGLILATIFAPKVVEVVK